MDEIKPLLLENLARRVREREEAEQCLERQIKACIEAGYPSATIAAELGCRPNTVRAMRIWRERKQ